jgi:hypothetical protein
MLLRSLARIIAQTFTPKPVSPMTLGIITIDQDQFVDFVKDTNARVNDADGGWQIQATTLPRPIFVPFNQPFSFGEERVIVQRSRQLEDVLDRIDGIAEA